jgi:hypothetical protein
MQSIAADLDTIIHKYIDALRSTPESEMSYKPSPAKWSKREILGHLIDSAQSNIRRFVVAQYEDAPRIIYNQDEWVKITNYQEYLLKDIIELWFLINKHIVFILKNTSAEKAQRKVQTESLNTIEWIARDYNKHLLHHLHQVLNLEVVAYP